MKSNSVYINFNALGIAMAFVMLGLSIWLAPVDLSTKGFWAMGVFLLTLSLVNFVKYRMDERATQERVNMIEQAKTERLLTDFVRES
ncbi:YiaA/YiaB family inner membrane protein [Rhizobium sp. RU36D]|uniref:YiaA/YiaB family inner membrane protein n=1 Tax=Rhizobium sp. RU36D TaxID=1907415 RepID=UPI0009D8B385|nr:YiaA/YiaB family inner membrane protein [Rhizobium sp. RU36D]SMD15734.1 hypothetical protein SAMN05880593_12822 [Rhizobium sp. RU36D]